MKKNILKLLMKLRFPLSVLTILMGATSCDKKLQEQPYRLTGEVPISHMEEEENPPPRMVGMPSVRGMVKRESK